MAKLAVVTLQDVAAQIVHRQALLDDDERARLRVIETRRHRLIPPLDGGLYRRLRKRLIRGVRVIDNYAIVDENAVSKEVTASCHLDVMDVDRSHANSTNRGDAGNVP